MQVIKRNGTREPLSAATLERYLEDLARNLDVNVPRLASKIMQGLHDGVKTTEVDTLAAETAAYHTTDHHDYSTLASRITVASLHKATHNSLLETAKVLAGLQPPMGTSTATSATQILPKLLSKEIYAIIEKEHVRLEQAIDYKRDFNYDYFGIRTLMRSYLTSVHGKIVERPQHMLMRVAIGIHRTDIDSALQSYELMSQLLFTHASPTLFHAGTTTGQLSSCFLLTMKEDSVDGIFDTLKRCAVISRTGGGIGLSVSSIRAAGTLISSTGGTAGGIVPMLRIFNQTACYVDQGGKRPGSIAVYLEPWHADIGDFLELKKNTGKEERRARDLFYALWIPDLFMRRVEADEDWTLLCPKQCADLDKAWGPRFEELYTAYEQQPHLRRKVVKARQLWFSILESQMETGTPYLLYKDACNAKSNQQHLGTIRSSNLCAEIVEYTAEDEVAVCNLASIALPRFVNTETGTFDHQRLYEITGVITKNLDRVIDVTHYPLPEARYSNMRHRPIGIGIQGLADVFILMRMPFDSPEALQLNKEIAETIYYAALSASNRLAKELGTYPTYPGSPVSRGILQHDMWGVQPPSTRWDWLALRESIKAHGVRNSLLVALMPTASTSQILGHNECFEPYTSNIYSRRVLSGEFVVVNKHLMRDLIKLGLWDSSMKEKIMQADGSIQGIEQIPADIRALYKTSWEIKQKSLVDMAVGRGPFVDQSQSLNIFIAQPNTAMLTSLHFYTWKKGLKTGIYYLRSQPAARAIRITVSSAEKVASAASTDKVSSPDKMRQSVSASISGENSTSLGSSPTTPSGIPPAGAVPPAIIEEGEACRAGCISCSS